jgi:hypothetical protein
MRSQLPPARAELSVWTCNTLNVRYPRCPNVVTVICLKAAQHRLDLALRKSLTLE